MNDFRPLIPKVSTWITLQNIKTVIELCIDTTLSLIRLSLIIGLLIAAYIYIPWDFIDFALKNSFKTP